MVAHGGEESVATEGERACAEGDLSDADEEEKEDELQGIDEVVRDLRGDQIEAEQESDEKAEDGGRAEERVDANDESDCERPCQLSWGGAYTEKIEQRKDDASLKERCACGSER